MSRTDQFFKKKQSWSKIKDDVLRTYLEPYLSKVSFFRNPIRIADCFAGKGRFDDGEPGSPLIICDAIQKQLGRAENMAQDIKAILIEREYMTDLKKNVSALSPVHFLEGDYEQKMETFIDGYDAVGKHLFLYVDPFGIKSIRFSYFEHVRKKRFNTAELLLNLNAFGFLREGCRWLGLEMRNESEEPLEYDPDVNSPDRLDEVAGGTYWREIVRDYYSDKLSMKDAEEKFVKLYCERLGTVFKYVVNTPIKAKLDHIPKYRIVFGTNHEDGLLLMADNMSKRWEEFREQARGGESYLFEMDFPDSSKLAECWGVEHEIPTMIDGEINLKSFLVKLIEKYGIAFPLRWYTDCLKRLDGGAIRVRRVPELTSTGKVRSGWAYDGKDYEVYISRKKQWQQNLL
jgi:three-Cys-motif partner protein